MVTEATLKQADGGLAPDSEGWFVVNARDAAWLHNELGSYSPFESKEARFQELGINLSVLQPGQPSCMYHAEAAQEDFLVVSGECLLLVEEEERPLRAWDFFHCPAHTRHVLVGAGDGPCVIVSVGARPKANSVVYPRSELALQHGAGVEAETAKPPEAYARFSAPAPGPPPELPPFDSNPNV